MVSLAQFFDSQCS